MKKDISDGKKKIKVESIVGISKENSDLIIQYVLDMEHGLNVSLKSIKGGRGYIRLNTIKEKMAGKDKKIN